MTFLAGVKVFMTRHVCENVGDHGSLLWNMKVTLSLSHVKRFWKEPPWIHKGPHGRADVRLKSQPLITSSNSLSGSSSLQVESRVMSTFLPGHTGKAN